MAVARLVVDEWLRERRPAPDLADRLLCVWRGDLGDAALPLPDERLDLVWVDDGSLWLSGPETTSWSRGYPPGTTAVGVGFRPGVGPPLLHLAASEVRDTRARLEELWGDRDAHELAERVAAHPDDRGRAGELERAVRRLAVRARPVDEVALQVAARLNQPRPASVSELSRATGLSQRQLHRRCTAAFGYGPALLARMLRLQRALRLARSHPGPLRLAELAAAAGYFDQQHFAHEVRAIMGTTPARLLRSRWRPIRTRHRLPGRGTIPQRLPAWTASPGFPVGEGACRMLKDAKALSGFAVDDVPRAKEFYGTTLGLEVLDAPLGVDGADVPAGLELRLGPGTRVMVYPKPDHTPATFTILNFVVDDIERAVDELTARGVRFEHYESPKTDAKGIHRSPEVRPVAWFRDPAGNILSIMQE